MQRASANPQADRRAANVAGFGDRDANGDLAHRSAQLAQGDPMGECAPNLLFELIIVPSRTVKLRGGSFLRRDVPHRDRARPVMASADARNEIFEFPYIARIWAAERCYARRYG